MLNDSENINIDIQSGLIKRLFVGNDASIEIKEV
jgi:hypothetical protein